MKQNAFLIVGVLLGMLGSNSVAETITASNSSAVSSETSYIHPSSETYTPTLSPTATASSDSSSTVSATGSFTTIFSTTLSKTTTSKSSTSRCSSLTNDHCTCLAGTSGSHCGGHPGLDGKCDQDTVYSCKKRTKDWPASGQYCKSHLCYGHCGADPQTPRNDKCFPV